MSPRDRRRWRCGWPPSSTAGSGWARRCGRSRSRPAAARCSWSPARSSSAGAVVSALPAGPFRDIAVEGVSDARLESLHRQRHALAAKFVAAYDRPFWRDRGQNGLTESEGILGSSWPQNEGVLSCLVPPERIAAYLSTAARHRREEALAELADWFGLEALTPIATFERLWGTDPLDAGLRDAVAAGRRAPGRAAARHPRAAVLRVRLRPVGGRLHGGRGAHRPGGGLRSAGARMNQIEVRWASRADGDGRGDVATSRNGTPTLSETSTSHVVDPPRSRRRDHRPPSPGWVPTARCCGHSPVPRSPGRTARPHRSPARAHGMGSYGLEDYVEAKHNCLNHARQARARASEFASARAD